MGKLDAEEAVQPGVEFMQFVGAVDVGFYLVSIQTTDFCQFLCEGRGGGGGGVKLQRC